MYADLIVEYIGQLEGELAGKTSEADELRQKNSELMAENARLTDLTRLLLSSPAFSDFLNDLSGTGPRSAAIQGLMRSPPQSQTPQPALAPKDVNPNQRRQSSTHTSMAMIPEESSNDADASDNHYNSANGSYGMFDAQVYALPVLSEAPDLDSIDFTLLNDKTASSTYTERSTALKFEPAPVEPITKHVDVPALDDIPFVCVEGGDDEEDLVSEASKHTMSVQYEHDPLYAEQPQTASSASSTVSEARYRALLDTPSSPPALEKFDLVVIPEALNVTEDTIVKFERNCRILDMMTERIERITGRP